MLAIQVAELRFATEEGVWVFDGLSFGVPREGFVWVVGPPGSGKTLLVNILLGRVRPHGGQILLLGRNIRRLSQRKFQEVRRKVGYMPERLLVLSQRTVLGNLEFKLRALGVTGEAKKEAIARALDLSGLRGHEGRKAEELSALELWRLSLALALCPECSILLADDPLRHLAQEEQDQFVSVLNRANQAGVTTLATSRDPAPLLRAGFPSGTQDARGIVFLRESVVR